MALQSDTAKVKVKKLLSLSYSRAISEVLPCFKLGLVPPATFQTLVVVLVLWRLDYDNGLLVDLPAYLVRQLQ